MNNLLWVRFFEGQVGWKVEREVKGKIRTTNGRLRKMIN